MAWKNKINFIVGAKKREVKCKLGASVVVVSFRLYC